MKRMFGVLFLLAFSTGGVFFACTNNDENPPELSSSGGSGHSSTSSNSISVISSSSTVPDEPSSSSSLINISSADVSSSSIATTPSSSSSSSSIAGISATSSTAVVVISSSSRASSSSVAQSPCVQPQNGVPPGGITSCIIVNGKCYTCNPERGNECNQGWIWNGGNASGDAYWYKEVDCKGSTGPTPGTSSAGAATSSNSGGGGTSSNSGNSGTPSYTPTSPGTETSKVTHYWDACKPSCSWSTNSGGKPANACNITGSNIGHSDADRSACDGANAFMCMNNAPWKVGNVSFGYVAGNIGKCGDCYQFDFPNGQVMVVMANNHGAIHDGAKFDLMIPGGGVGDFNALTRQVTNSGVSNPDMGVQYGGFRGKCGWTHSAANVNCVEKMCNDVFKNLPDLKAGCLWYVETLGRAPGSNNASWDNPTVKYKLVTCPKELTDRY